MLNEAFLVYVLPKRAPNEAFLKLDIYEVSHKELNATPYDSMSTEMFCYSFKLEM